MASSHVPSRGIALDGEAEWVRQFENGELSDFYALDVNLLRKLGVSEDEEALRKALEVLKENQIPTWYGLRELVEDEARAVHLIGDRVLGKNLWNAILQYDEKHEGPKRARLASSRTGCWDLDSLLQYAKIALEKRSQSAPKQAAPPDYKLARTEREIQSAFDDGRAAQAIISKIENSPEFYSCLLVAAPGSGEVSTTRKIASCMYTLWISCGKDAFDEELGYKPPNSVDSSFLAMMNVMHRRLEDIDEIWPYAHSLEAVLTFSVYILARLIFLFAFLDSVLEPTPYKWLTLQESDKFQYDFREFFKLLDKKMLSKEAIEEALAEVRGEVTKRIQRQPDKKAQLIVCVSNAGVERTHFWAVFARGVFANQTRGNWRDFVCPMAQAPVQRGRAMARDYDNEQVQDGSSRGNPQRLRL